MECKECGSFFSTRSNLNQHIRKSCNKGVIIETDFQCEYCKMYFSTKSSLTRHINKSCKNIKRKIKILKKPIANSSDHIREEKTKAEIDALKRSEKQCETLTLALELALKQINKQKLELNYIKQSDIVVPIKHPGPKEKHPILSDNILEVLTDKLGKKESVNFLMTNFLEKKYGKIIEAAYLNDIMSDKYPMSCSEDNHFRYLNDKWKLIDDNGGDEIVKMIIYHIQNAVLRVTNMLIKKYVNDSESTPLYDTFDIGKVQGELCEISGPRVKTKIKKYLSKRVLNPNHPFFDTTMNFQKLRLSFCEENLEEDI